MVMFWEVDLDVLRCGSAWPGHACNNQSLNLWGIIDYKPYVFKACSVVFGVMGVIGYKLSVSDEKVQHI